MNRRTLLALLPAIGLVLLPAAGCGGSTHQDTVASRPLPAAGTGASTSAAAGVAGSAAPAPAPPAGAGATTVVPPPGGAGSTTAAGPTATTGLPTAPATTAPAIAPVTTSPGDPVPGTLAPAAGGRIAIDATASGDPYRLLADLQALGLTDGAVFGRVVGGLLPAEALPAAERLPSALSVRVTGSTNNLG